MIQPFHFGSSAQRLFGAYHEPYSGARAQGGVVLCYPAAHEYIWAHRAFRQLAEHLAEAGFHVLRFDYFGTGDSAGEADDVSLTAWTANIATAVEELKQMTGLPSLSVAGLRIGATLAARAAGGRADIERLVLWDPVVCGATYLDEVVSLDAVLRAVAPSARAMTPADAPSRELLGFPMNDHLERELTALRLEANKTGAKRGVLVIVSEERGDYVGLRLTSKNAVCDWTYRHVPTSGRWDQLDRFGTALLPREIIAATTSWLATT